MHTICIDEQTGIQALERIAEDRLAAPGQLALREYEYIRHGTLCLFANFDVASGRVLSPLIAPTRSEPDFVENLDRLIDSDRKGHWRFITDNLNTHCSESLVVFVAEQCGIDCDLGIKGQCGILESVKSRQAFLSDASHRLRFIYTPRHCSWLNQVEIWLGVLRRKLTRGGSFCSLENLKSRISRFIDYYNRTMAKPYRWTYKGQLLCE